MINCQGLGRNNEFEILKTDRRTPTQGRRPLIIMITMIYYYYYHGCTNLPEAIPTRTL